MSFMGVGKDERYVLMIKVKMGVASLLLSNLGPTKELYSKSQGIFPGVK